eukprot:4277757-Prymnesium_polylepis.1
MAMRDACGDTTWRHAHSPTSCPHLLSADCAHAELFVSTHPPRGSRPSEPPSSLAAVGPLPPPLPSSLVSVSTPPLTQPLHAPPPRLLPAFLLAV